MCDLYKLYINFQLYIISVMYKFFNQKFLRLKDALKTPGKKNTVDTKYSDEIDKNIFAYKYDYTIICK